MSKQKETIELQAVAEKTSKRMGEAVEAAFLAKVCKLRIPVCKPWGDSERYDFVVDWGKGFWRVQVKGGTIATGRSIRRSIGRKGETIQQGRHGLCGGARGAEGCVVCGADRRGRGAGEAVV